MSKALFVQCSWQAVFGSEVKKRDMPPDCPAIYFVKPVLTATLHSTHRYELEDND